MAIRDKTTINKWIYERSHKSLNSYSLVEYNKIYPNTNSWKFLQEESLWQVDLDNLYFWDTLNKTHQGILVWIRNNRLHTLNKKHVYKDRKETTHGKIGERTYIKIYINQIWVQCMSSGHKTNIQRNNVSKIERKEKIQESPLHPSITLPLSPKLTLLYEYDYSHLKTTSLFCHEW